VDALSAAGVTGRSFAGRVSMS